MFRVSNVKNCHRSRNFVVLRCMPTCVGNKKWSKRRR